MPSEHELYYVLLPIGLTVLGLGLVSGLINYRLWISEPLVCGAVGVLMGPLGVGWIQLDLREPSARQLLIEGARVTLAIAVIGAAVRLPNQYFRSHWRELLVILGVGMPAMWLMVALLALALVNPHLTMALALLIGAALAPTDPVLAAPIVTGALAEARVPQRVRNIITAESGSNDGLALILVVISVALIPGVSGAGSPQGVAFLLLWEIGGGVIVGGLTGLLTGRLIRWSARKRKAEPTSLITVALALAVTTLALARVLGMDGILASFAAGAMLNEMLEPSGEQEERQKKFDEAVRRFFDLPFFVLLGAVLPWDAWADVGPRGVLFVLGVLLLRRLPVWLVMRKWMPSTSSLQATLFAGWFGPIGIAAVFYALEWGTRVDIALWPIVSLAVAASLIAHGITGTPVTRALLERRARERGR